MFEGEGHGIGEVSSCSMDGKPWHSDTPGGSYKNVQIVYFSYIGGNKNKRIEGVHKNIFHDQPGVI